MTLESGQVNFVLENKHTVHLEKEKNTTQLSVLNKNKYDKNNFFEFPHGCVRAFKSYGWLIPPLL